MAETQQKNAVNCYWIACDDGCCILAMDSLSTDSSGS